MASADTSPVRPNGGFAAGMTAARDVLCQSVAGVTGMRFARLHRANRAQPIVLSKEPVSVNV